MDELDSRRFGRYLRRVREDRKLSLDAVEEMTTGYPDRVTKSHLSRIENGSAVPSFGKMFALSQVYGIPIAALAERFEMDLLREMAPVEKPPTSAETVVPALKKLELAGDYTGGLTLVAAVSERLGEAERSDRGYLHTLKIFEANFLAHLERYELAKVLAEQLLADTTLTAKQRLQSLLIFITCCYRLRRYTIADMAIQQAEQRLRSEGHPVRMLALFTATRASVQTALGLLDEAIDTFRKAIKLYREVPDPFEECRAQINLAHTMTRAGHPDRALPYLRSALKAAEATGYDRLAGLALSHMAVISFGKNDLEATESWALRSNAIARPREYLSLIFRNCYYLHAIAIRRGDGVSAKQNERTLKALLNRVDPELTEVAAFRSELAGGRR